ncbi:CoA ester lyase [Kribbella lupini]|uniref:CoA ester lyase n=1 Tax=Kribbella lupini TaxID=291602 RepID=A0ABN2CJQ9_9ACTN
MNAIFRSCLVTPAAKTSMLENAARSAADLVIVDLEDGVSWDRKDAARRLAAEASSNPVWSTRPLAVRINQPGTGLALKDLTEIVRAAGPHLDLVVVPKVTSPRDVWWVDTTLTELEAAAGANHRIGLQVLVEDVAAMHALTEIARCSTRIRSLAFGPGDFSASMGVDLVAAGNDHPDLYPGDVWHSIRTAISVAAHTAGVAAVDGAYAAITDTAGYRRECTWSRTIGFSGKWAIHPNQVAVANDVYSPTAEAIAAAERMLTAFEAATAAGLGAAAHEGNLIDAATIRTARATLTIAGRLGLRPGASPAHLTEGSH